MLNLADSIRGYIDTIILFQLYQEDSYGYQINKNIMSITNNQFEIKEATLYTSFRRLEKQGFILSYWGDATTGARRRYYTLTEDGLNVLKENQADWFKMQKIISNLIGGAIDE